MRISTKSQIALALLTIGLGAGVAAAQDTLFVKSAWGPAPATKSVNSIPREAGVEDRVWFNPQNGQFFLTEAAALAATAPEKIADGPDAIPTGLQNIQYFDDSAITYNTAVPATIDDPTTTAVESIALTLGTNAFATIKDAIDNIATRPVSGAGSVNKIVILGGFYYEPIFYPRNNNLIGGASNDVQGDRERTTAYYAGRTLADFNGKMQQNFTIAGDPLDKPVITRGILFDGEKYDGLTIENIVLAGIPGWDSVTNLPNGVPRNGVTGNPSQRHTVLIQYRGASDAWPDPGLAGAGIGYRKNLTLRGIVFEGYGIRIPFGAKQAVYNATTNPVNLGYTTAPAFNNIVFTAGGRGGGVLDGEYGTYTFENLTFQNLRSFYNWDFNANGLNNTTWTEFYARGNSSLDCWGSFSIRGEDPAGTRPSQFGLADVAVIENNTVRNMGEGILSFLSLSASNDFLYDHAPNSGAAFKMFNIRDAVFRNNTIFRVNIMQDWFAKTTKVPPGHPDFLPMGAGLVIRDIRSSANNLNGPWSAPLLSNYTIVGNRFDSAQQGVALDAGFQGNTGQKFIPPGIAAGNTFVNCRTGFFFYDGIISSIAMTITNNVFTSPSNDPLGIGVPAGSNTNVVGGIVLDTQAGTNAEGANLNLTDNFFDGGPNGPAGIKENSPTISSTDITGDGPGEFLPAYPTLDSDGDGLADVVEDANGNQTVDIGETNPFLADTDGDGIPDGIEVRLGYDPTDPNDPLVGGNGVDSDGDRIPDLVEDALGLDKTKADQDSDGIRDDYELLVGTDPRNPNSKPLLGDANRNGVVNSTDAVRILAAFLNLATLNDTDKANSDINRDGRVNNTDAVILYQRTQNNIPYVPFP